MSEKFDFIQPYRHFSFPECAPLQHFCLAGIKKGRFRALVDTD